MPDLGPPAKGGQRENQLTGLVTDYARNHQPSLGPRLCPLDARSGGDMWRLEVHDLDIPPFAVLSLRQYSATRTVAHYGINRRRVLAALVFRRTLLAQRPPLA